MDSLNQNKNKQEEQDSQNYFFFNAEEEEELNLEGEINGLEEEKYLFKKEEQDPSQEEAQDLPSGEEVDLKTSENQEEVPGQQEEDSPEPEESGSEENSNSKKNSVTSIGDILKSSSWFNSSEQNQEQQQEEDIEEVSLSEELPEQEQQEELKEEGVIGPVSEEATDQEETSDQEETVSFPKSKIALMKKLLRNVQENNEKLLHMFEGLAEEEDIEFSEEKAEDKEEEEENADNIIEGVFDGENMIGPDGRQYSVPTNYASKSKLVEGDILKLTIAHNGKFLYKQIHPISRARIIGTLRKGNDGNYYVVKDDRKWKVLQASVTYFKGDIGDEVSLLIPAEGDSKWGAIENIVKQ